MRDLEPEIVNRLLVGDEAEFDRLFIALQEASRCSVDTRPGTEVWQVLWAVFSFVGKLATSLALLTYSGVLKPKEEA